MKNTLQDSLRIILLKWTVFAILGAFIFWDGGGKLQFPRKSLLSIVVFVWLCFLKLDRPKRWAWAGCAFFIYLIIEWQLYASEKLVLAGLSTETLRGYAVTSLCVLAFLFLWIIAVPQEQDSPFRSFRSTMLVRAITFATGIAVASPGIFRIVEFFDNRFYLGHNDFQFLHSALLWIGSGVYGALMTRELLMPTAIELRKAFATKKKIDFGTGAGCRGE